MTGCFALHLLISSLVWIPVCLWNFWYNKTNNKENPQQTDIGPVFLCFPVLWNKPIEVSIPGR